MQYNFDNLEITVNSQLFFVSGTLEVEEAQGFGDWNDELEATNCELSNVTNEDGDDVLHLDDEIFDAIYEKFITDADWHDEILTVYADYVGE